MTNGSITTNLRVAYRQYSICQMVKTNTSKNMKCRSVYFVSFFFQKNFICLPLNCSSIIAESEREGTRAETRIGLSAKRTSPFKSAGGQFSRLLAVEECG